ncbi:hypothetical protein Gogos_015088, partial [Gossypium gossypioides]|nr:hypothetical protein [Gossypium gossypioides]
MVVLPPYLPSPPTLFNPYHFDRPYIIRSSQVNEVNFVSDLIGEQSGKWKESVVNITFNDREAKENTEYPIVAVRVTEQVKIVIREIWRVYSAQWVRRLVNDDVCLRCEEAAETTSHACQDCVCAVQVKVNFDGGFYNDLEASSSGIIIRDNKGLMMGATCNWNRNIPSVEVTEALELRIQGMDRSEVSNYICEAKQIIMGFESFKFQHIRRGGNRVAYLLMKKGFIQKRDVRWVKEGPVAIREIVVRYNRERELIFSLDPFKPKHVIESMVRVEAVFLTDMRGD